MILNIVLLLLFLKDFVKDNTKLANKKNHTMWRKNVSSLMGERERERGIWKYGEKTNENEI